MGGVGRQRAAAERFLRAWPGRSPPSHRPAKDPVRSFGTAVSAAAYQSNSTSAASLLLLAGVKRRFFLLPTPTSVLSASQLATEPQVRLTRSLSVDDDPVDLRPRRALRALVAVAAPRKVQDYHLAPIDAPPPARIFEHTSSVESGNSRCFQRFGPQHNTGGGLPKVRISVFPCPPKLSALWAILRAWLDT